MGFIYFEELDVGQGSGNFIEIYDHTLGTDPVLATTVLIDLGSEAKERQAGGPSVAYIVTRLHEMAQPTIDTLIISHSDSDHHNLIGTLLDAFQPVGTPGYTADQTLQINFVRYGGDKPVYAKKVKGAKRATNVLTRIKKYMPNTTEMKPFSADFTNFGLTPLQPVRVAGGRVPLYIMSANAPELAAAPQGATGRMTAKRGRPDAFAINTKSVVVVAEYNGVQFVVTGDATGNTILACNGNISPQVRAQYLNNVFMLTLPHHGARNTLLCLHQLGVTRALNSDPARQNVVRFADNIRAQTVTASAERVKTFKHPFNEVIAFFWAHLSDEQYWVDPLLEGTPSDANHFYTAYFTRDDGLTLQGTGAKWPPRLGWYTVETPKNVFTNLYYDDNRAKGGVVPPNPMTDGPVRVTRPDIPPEGVAWSFGVGDDGVRTIDRTENRGPMLAVRDALARGEPPERIPRVRLAPRVPPREMAERVRALLAASPAAESEAASPGRPRWAGTRPYPVPARAGAAPGVPAAPARMTVVP